MRARIAYSLLLTVSILPRTLSQAIGKLIGWVNYRFDTRAAKVTRVNVSLCLPEQTAEQSKRLVFDSLIHTGQTMMETPAVWLGARRRVDSWISDTSNETLLTDAMRAGQGVIVLLPHLGNWELFNVYFARLGSMTALYQPPRQAYLRPMMREIRQNFGNELVSPSVKGLSRLYRCLEDGGVVTVLPDQIPASGAFSAFFGVQALTDKLIPRLIRKTGATVVVVNVVRQPDGTFHIVCSRPDSGIYDEDLAVALRAMNLAVETSVLPAPAQYQWEYKRFRERPAGEKKVYRFNKPLELHS
jgi:Kdo2-lipid IVA lauroyltransferase/acyltransferase